jgi:hypothetical protein
MEDFCHDGKVVGLKRFSTAIGCFGSWMLMKIALEGNGFRFIIQKQTQRNALSDANKEGTSRLAINSSRRQIVRMLDKRLYH